MPLFRFRLEAQDGSGHFRAGTTEARSKEAAKAFLEYRELGFVLFELDAERAAELCETYGLALVETEVELEDGTAEVRVDIDATLELLPVAAPVNASEDEKAAFRALSVRDRSHLNLHRQSKPYKLVKLEEVK